MVAVSQNIVNSLTGGTLDIQKLATDLVSAVRAPQQTALDTRKTQADAKISSIGAIMSSASSLKTALAGYGDPNSLAFQPVADPNATFQFHASAAARAVDLTFTVNNPASADTVMMAPLQVGAAPGGAAGTGSLNIHYTDSTGAAAVASFDLSQYKTLGDLQTAIQGTTGFDASIVATGSSTTSVQYLSITHGIGAANNFSVDTTNADGTARTDGLQITAGSAQSSGVDASITYNGVNFTSPNNTFANFVPDLQIYIKSSTPAGTSVHLTTSTNTATCQQALQDIVTSFNSMLKTIQAQVTYDQDPVKRGGLAMDPVTNAFLEQMRQLSTQPINLGGGKSATLADLGVRTNIDGSLQVDQTQLTRVVTTQPGLLESIISSRPSDGSKNADGTLVDFTGALERFSKMTDVVLGVNGTTSEFQALSDTTKNTDLVKITDAETKLTTDMDALQAKYLQQFAAMQTIVNSSKSTQDALTQSMQAWTYGLKA